MCRGHNNKPPVAGEALPHRLLRFEFSRGGTAPRDAPAVLVPSRRHVSRLPGVCGEHEGVRNQRSASSRGRGRRRSRVAPRSMNSELCDSPALRLSRLYYIARNRLDRIAKPGASCHRPESDSNRGQFSVTSRKRQAMAELPSETTKSALSETVESALGGGCR